MPDRPPDRRRWPAGFAGRPGRWRRHVDRHVFFWAEARARRVRRCLHHGSALASSLPPAARHARRSTPLHCWSGTARSHSSPPSTPAPRCAAAPARGATRTRCGRSADYRSGPSPNWRSGAASTWPACRRLLLTLLGRFRHTAPASDPPRDKRETIHARYGRVPVHLRVRLRRAIPTRSPTGSATRCWMPISPPTPIRASPARRWSPPTAWCSPARPAGRPRSRPTC